LKTLGTEDLGTFKDGFLSQSAQRPQRNAKAAGSLIRRLFSRDDY
jgi:hypothetical protein